MIPLEDARRVISAAEEKAREISMPMNIAVLDAEGNLGAFARIEDAWLDSIEISIDKAYTSTSFDMATLDLASQA